MMRQAQRQPPGQWRPLVCSSTNTCCIVLHCTPARAELAIAGAAEGQEPGSAEEWAEEAQVWLACRMEFEGGRLWPQLGCLQSITQPATGVRHVLQPPGRLPLPLPHILEAPLSAAATATAAAAATATATAADERDQLAEAMQVSLEDAEQRKQQQKPLQEQTPAEIAQVGACPALPCLALPC